VKVETYEEQDISHREYRVGRKKKTKRAEGDRAEGKGQTVGRRQYAVGRRK